MKPKNLTRILIIIVILLSLSLTITAAKLISIKKDINAAEDVKPPVEEELKDVINKKPSNEEDEIDNENTEDPVIEGPPVEPQEIDEEPTEIQEPLLEPPVVNEPVNEKPAIEQPAENENTDNHTNDDEKEQIAIVESKYISKDEAINIALKKIGKKSTLLEIEEEFDDNPPKYEIKIKKNKWEYEIEIHARTGAILDYEKEKVD
ncbi:PepSY domain-containing protein [Tissierella sp. Yu-01]|uniref:PepSY domain-containing protein n=1 Tax=Tissierella sp. Yu-01 TaxID=3035694 RepID=UPI00240DF771|nr:PepSY domain-containing protein [Tissierella sp. Yu-01]WFA08162.1 PepSY domain-containing protein [Tissierella sp. Yu-01]